MDCHSFPYYKFSINTKQKKRNPKKRILVRVGFEPTQLALYESKESGAQIA